MVKSLYSFAILFNAKLSKPAKSLKERVTNPDELMFICGAHNVDILCNQVSYLIPPPIFAFLSRALLLQLQAFRGVGFLQF